MAYVARTFIPIRLDFLYIHLLKIGHFYSLFLIRKSSTDSSNCDPSKIPAGIAIPCPRLYLSHGAKDIQKLKSTSPGKGMDTKN